LHHFGSALETETDTVRPGIVHRLDKDTSGLLVVAKDEKSLAYLQAELKERRIKRIYKALVWGSPGADSGAIDLPVGRSHRARKKMMVYPRHGREAITSCEVEKRMDLASLVRLRLQTGRTHQIRVHMSYFGYPVVGDPTYGGRARYVRRLHKQDKDRAVVLLGILSRQALHAVELELPHPDDGRTMSFKSELPGDINAAMEYLESLPERDLR
jgi:23S rRNA pseudouridine1911/1915/1917 synthase